MEMDEDEYTIPSVTAPVLILSLDTTTRGGSAAVLRDDTVLAVAEGNATRTHGERLPAELATVLDQAGLRLSDIDLLSVARGPGAFTGLRIGLAAMQGLAMVTGRPVVGVSALDALAATAFARAGSGVCRIGVWMDAARGEVFAVAFEANGEPGPLPALIPLTEPEVDTPHSVLARWHGRGWFRPAEAHQPAPVGTRPAPGDSRLPTPADLFTGDGAVTYASVLGGVPLVPPAALAPAIARLGRRLAGAGLHQPHDLQPLYVRRPDAERALRP